MGVIKMIEIRETLEQDIGFIASCLENENEDFFNQCGYGRWYTFPVTSEQIKSVMKTRKDNTKYYVILNDSKLIGAVELDSINWEEKECSIARFIIANRYRSQGFGAVALQKLVENAFYSLNMNRVRLSVYDFNIDAIKCYVKAGFNEYNRVERPNGWIAIEMDINKTMTRLPW
jgi:RimJ/RimL family protein N-acetyltransferase